MNGLRYGFDPMGRAQSYVEEWEREFAESRLRAPAREARGAQHQRAHHVPPSAGLWTHSSQRARWTHNTPRRFHPVH